MSFSELKPPPGLQGAVFSNEQKEEARRTCRLLFISLMTSRVCNLHCPDCYAWNKDLATSTVLTKKERKDIMFQAKQLGAKTLRIAGEGEPLLDDGFWDLVDNASELSMDVFFFTNGTFITKDVANKIAKYGNLTPVIKFSGDSETMEFLTGGKGFFRKGNFINFAGLRIPTYLMNAIEAGLNRTDPDGNSRLGIEFLLRRSNLNFACDIFRWARRNNIVPYFEQNLEAGRALEWDLYDDQRIDNSDAFDLSKTLRAIDQREFGFTWSPSIPYLVGGICESEKEGCKKYTYNIVISSEGQAYPCYATKISLGNVRELNLFDILNHPNRLQLLSKPIFNCLCRVYSRSSKNKAVKSPADLDICFDYKILYCPI